MLCHEYNRISYINIWLGKLNCIHRMNLHPINTWPTQTLTYQVQLHLWEGL